MTYGGSGFPPGSTAVSVNNTETDKVVLAIKKNTLNNQNLEVLVLNTYQKKQKQVAEM